MRGQRHAGSATSIATYDRYVPILRQWRQTVGHEEVRAGNAKRRAQFAVGDTASQLTALVSLEVA